MERKRRNGPQKPFSRGNGRPSRPFSGTKPTTHLKNSFGKKDSRPFPSFSDVSPDFPLERPRHSSEKDRGSRPKNPGKSPRPIFEMGSSFGSRRGSSGSPKAAPSLPHSGFPVHSASVQQPFERTVERKDFRGRGQGSRSKTPYVKPAPIVQAEPTFPMRINRYLAIKNYATRRGADEMIIKKIVFVNGRVAMLGDKVQESDVVEVRFHGKPTPLVYLAYNKPKGVATHPEQGSDARPMAKTAKSQNTKQAAILKNVFPVGGLDKDSRGLIIFTNDGRVTDRLLSPNYAHEKEYVVSTQQQLRSSFKRNMEAGVRIDNEMTEPCKVKLIDEDSFRVILHDEKRHQVRRMCVALFQDVKDIQCVRIMNVQLGSLKEGGERRIEGDELKNFLTSLELIEKPSQK